VSFIGFIRDYAAAHPATRATTELLFILDSLAEANRNILNTLMSIDPTTQLSTTRSTDPDAYALVIELQNYYKHVLSDRGLISHVNVDDAYNATRVEILQGIIRTTPDHYRSNDARLLIGTIHWGAGRFAPALSAWCGITTDNSDAYADVYKAIRAIIRSDGSEPCATFTASSDVRREIDHVLRANAEDGWLFQFQRLWKFHYRFDTF
jgi:hypothetical protein